eukprot:10538053-Alexandrium_andersonii.AAC.1
MERRPCSFDRAGQIAITTRPLFTEQLSWGLDGQGASLPCHSGTGREAETVSPCHHRFGLCGVRGIPEFFHRGLQHNCLWVEQLGEHPRRPT